MKYSIFQLIIMFVILSSLISCGQKTKTSPNHDGEVFVKVRTIKVQNGWGYEIFSDSTVYIKQDIIPVIPNLIPFKTEEDAMRTGQYVLEKITKNQHFGLDSSDLIKLNIISSKAQ